MSHFQKSVKKFIEVAPAVLLFIALVWGLDSLITTALDHFRYVGSLEASAEICEFDLEHEKDMRTLMEVALVECKEQCYER